MLIAVATQRGSSPIEVRSSASPTTRTEEGEAHSEVEPKDGPSPIAPELKELAWGAGAFVVFAVLMRLVLFPREEGDGGPLREHPRRSRERRRRRVQPRSAEVAEYEAQLAGVQGRGRRPRRRRPPDARGRAPARLAEVNARIAERRAEAVAAGRGRTRRGARPDRGGRRRRRVEHRRTGDRASARTRAWCPAPCRRR